MTVSTEVNHNEYTGNGVTTSFPYTFRIFHASDLVVTTSDTNGTLRTLTLNTDYTVTGVGSYSGGAVVLPLPLANAWAISIERSLPVVQETDLRNQGKFFAETHEGAFDYLTMLIQQCFGWARLALLKPSFIARYYDARQNRIANLADPAAAQDAVNNRSMRSYVDAAVSGVVGGFGWFIQYGAGAVYRTFQDKMRDEVSIRDFGAGSSGEVTDSLLKAVAATTGRIIVPAGDYVATPTTSQVAGVLSSLSRLEINGTLTIRLPKGVATLNSPVLVELDGGNNLSIIGQDSVPLTITGQVSVTGSAGNYQVTLNVSTTAGISVGDFIHTNQAGGTGAFDIHRGVWEIIAIGSGTITVKNTCQLADFPSNAITSSTSRVLTSVLLFNRCDGFIVPSSDVGNMSNFVIAGNSDTYWSSSAVSTTELGTHGLAVGSNTVAVNGKTDNVNPQGRTGASVTFGQYMGVTGFDQQGIVTELGGSFWGDFTCSCNNKRRGFYASTASGIRAKQITANGNYLDGVIADLGGDIYSSSSSCAAGNGSNGISATQNGVIAWDTGKSSYNKLNGVNAVAGGFVQITSGYLQGNVATGANLAYGAIMYCDNSQITGNGTYGIYCQLSSKVRGPNCTITGNANYGIRGSHLSTCVFTGSTLTGNTAGELIFTDGALGINGSISYGGGAIATDIKLVNQSTSKGVRISGTSGGNSLVISHDINGSGTFSETYSFRSDNTGFIPTDDALKNVGRAANRFNVGFFAGGTQSTSDATLKDPIRDFTKAELNAAMRIAKMLGFWTWLDDAGKRLHAGTTVQAVLEVLEEEGLDWRNYGFIGFNEWENEYAPVTLEVDGVVIETGEMRLVKEAGSVWQLRDQEFDRFVMRGLSERLSIIEDKFASLIMGEDNI